MTAILHFRLFSDFAFCFCASCRFRFFTFPLFHFSRFAFSPFSSLFVSVFFATVGCVIMRLPKPITLWVGRKLTDKSKDGIMTEVLRVFAGLEVKAIQVAYEVVRVTFATPEHFRASKSYSGKHLFGLWYSILGGGPPVTCVHVFDYPFQEDDISLEVAFDAFGTVKSVKEKTYVSNPSVFNGTKLVKIVLSGVLPRFLIVYGYLCRLWYRGSALCLQSLRCSGAQVG